MNLLLVLILAAQEATVRGTVEVGHRVPSPRRIRDLGDPRALVAYPDGVLYEEISVDPRNRLKNAFVYVKSGLEGRAYPLPAAPALVEFEGFVLRPWMLGVRTAQPIVIRNRDDVTHNWHALPFANYEHNFGLRLKGEEERRSFPEPEVFIRASCDIHPWEECWMGVVANPFFAVTDGQGRFEIRGLPPGRYVFEVRHPHCKAAERTIEVTAGEVRELDFVVATKEGPPPRNWLPFYVAGGATAALLVVLGFLFRRPSPLPRHP